MNLYDLLADDLDPAAVLAAMSPRDRRALESLWAFWARPGQAWAPGPEFITVFESGRGFGKTRCAAEAVVQAAQDPERWGGYAMIVGVEPGQVERDCIFGKSGIVTLTETAYRTGVGLPIVSQNLVKHWLEFAAPRGGGKGLTVYWASSYNPKSVHGPDVGLVWWDEYGMAYHDHKDAQGNNAWQALEPAIRGGRPSSKVLITMTPSRRPEVRTLQQDAERPECRWCRASILAATPGGRWQGEPGREPWRLPTSPQRRLHPLLDTRTTEPVRICPRCGGEVVARVRTVFGSTLDNPYTDAESRQRAADALATGQTWARLRFAPRGEVDSAAEGALIREEHVQRVALPERAGRPGGQVPDRWADALADLGAVEVVVAVDPAATANATSDDTGIAAAASRRHGPHGDLQAVALEDASVGPGDVLAAGGGAPSAVWAPRAYWTALLWGASRVVVETNQGGDEVLTALKDLAHRPPDVAQVLRELRARVPDFAGVSDARLGVLANRVTATARGLRVETVRRRAPKAVRFEWYGQTSATGRQAIACAWWLDAGHWQQALGQATCFEPTPTGGRSAEKKDRWDAVVSAAQVLLGVRETHRGEVEEPAGGGWMGSVSAGALRR